MRCSLPITMLLVLLTGMPVLWSQEAADLDWPTYRRDNERTGQYPQDLPSPLRLQWIHRSPSKPVEAWPGTAQSDWWRKRGTPEKKRVVFDMAYEVVGAGERIYYGSSADDQLRCLDLKSGEQRWSFYAEAPIRLAPTIVGELILVGSDDGRVYALDRQSGELRWNVSLPEAEAQRLPGNGRVMSLYPVRSSVLVRGETGFFCSGLFPKSAGAWHCSVDLRNGRLLDHKAITASPQGYLEERNGKLFLPTGRAPAGATLAELHATGKPATAKAAPSEQYPFAMIETPNQRVGGGDGVVGLLSATGGEELWRAEVEGSARSLAIVRGKLLVSTDEGVIYCFGGEPREVPPTPVQIIGSPRPPGGPLDAAIESVIAQLPHDHGYALVLEAASDRGELVQRLATLSRMQVIALVEDRESADDLRERLGSQIAGGRFSVHVAPDPGSLPYAKHIFNLVTSPSGLAGKELNRYPDLRPLLRPGTGAAFFNGSAKPGYRAPKLDGVGEWTHMYADPGNTACSNDTRIGSQLGLQWFGRPGPQHIVDRHLRTAPSLVKNGYMFVPGRDYLFGIDAWNGAILWEKDVPEFRRIGALRDSGNLVATDEYVYAASGERCLVLEVMTGEQARALTLPEGFAGGSHEWGYAGVVGNTLVGSAVKKGSVFREMNYGAIYAGNYGDNTSLTCSDRLFATNRMNGEPLWSYAPSGSILNPSLALSESEVFFIESKNPETLTQKTGRLDYPLLFESHGASLVCLGLPDGSERWRVDLPADRGIQTLFVQYKDRVVVVTNSRNARAPDAKIATLHYDTRVFRADDGSLAWSDTRNFKMRPNLDHGEQDRHPAIVGDRLIVEPHIYDLATGKPRGEFKRGGGGCGTIAASSNSLYFRAGNPAAFDLSTGKQEAINKVSRPGCWINMIPAGGLLLVPEGSSGCTCNYAIQGSMAFAPK